MTGYLGSTLYLWHLDTLWCVTLVCLLILFCNISLCYTFCCWDLVVSILAFLNNVATNITVWPSEHVFPHQNFCWRWDCWMLWYAWVQLLQRVLKCFPKCLYFTFTHAHMLVNTQYCVREEFFPSSPALRPSLIGSLLFMFPDGFIVILGLLYAKIFSYF